MRTRSPTTSENAIENARTRTHTHIVVDAFAQSTCLASRPLDIELGPRSDTLLSMRLLLCTLCVAYLMLAACATAPVSSVTGALVPAGGGGDELRSQPRVGPFVGSFTPPPPPSDARLRLEPLGPEHTERDFEALVSSREHLRRTLAWGDWPEDGFTLEQNRGDLERHRAEFDAHEAYAYTVLDPTGRRCLGCVYLMPLPGGARDQALLAMWVREDEVAQALDAHLLRTLTEWFGRSWPLESWVWPVHPDNGRGRTVAEAQGLTAVATTALEESLPGHQGYAWHR